MLQSLQSKAWFFSISAHRHIGEKITWPFELIQKGIWTNAGPIKSYLEVQDT